MYAIIQTGGKQYRVQVGDQLEIEKLTTEAGQEVALDTLLVGSETEIKVGQPTLGTKVTAQVVAQTQGEKLIVYKYKKRKGFDKKRGHRQSLTLIKITGIAA